MDGAGRRTTREARRVRTRELLLAAAAEVFARRGFHAASVDEVAEAAGFTKGAVYANFSSKEDLFLALLDERIEADRRWIAAFAGLDDDAALVAALAGRGEPLDGAQIWLPLALEFWLYAARRPAVAASLAARYRTLRDALAGTLAALFEREGSEPPLPVEHLAAALLAMSQGLALHRAIDPDAAPADLFAAAAFRLVAGQNPVAEGDVVAPG